MDLNSYCYGLLTALAVWGIWLVVKFVIRRYDVSKVVQRQDEKIESLILFTVAWLAAREKNRQKLLKEVQDGEN